MDLPATVTPPTPDPRRTPGASLPVSPFGPVVYALLLGGATAGVFLAGGPQQGSMGIFLLCAGAALTAFPPRVKVEWRLWLPAAGTLAGASLALLPASTVRLPAWRQALGALPAVTLPGTISVAPALTVFWLTVLAISLLLALFLLAHPVRSHALRTLALSAAGAAGVYAAAAIYARETGWHYPFHGGATFGFFPNRNHTANFLFVGSLIALGLLGVVLREGRWLTGLLAAAAMTVCLVGLGSFSPSRAGIVFLLVGVVLWLAGLGRRHRDQRLMVSLVTLLLAVGVVFLLSGGEVRDRLLGLRSPTPAPTVAVQADPPPETGDTLHNLSTDFRLKIYRDTVAAIRDFPWTGMGLGAFPLVFPQYRRASLSETASVHPESDWLMLTAELGVPAALCLLAFVALAAGRLRFERDHPYWPLRWGCAVAAGAAVMHGMVDVPLHRVQLGWWVLVVAGLALQSARTGPAVRSSVQHALFVVGGVAALMLGASLVRAEWFGGAPLPPFVAARAQADVLAAFNRKDTEGALNLARQAVKTSPMAAPLYYQIGNLLLYFEDTEADVDQAFAAQRCLNPGWPAVPFQQGDTWAAVDPQRTIALWRDAFERARRIDQAQNARPEHTLAYYRYLLYRAASLPAVQEGLGSLATQGPGYALAWLETVGPDVAARGLPGLVEGPGWAQAFPAPDRPRLLLLWQQKGDRGALGRFVNDHPDWQAAAWPVHLRELMDGRQFETVVREVAAHDGIDLQLPEPAAAGGAPAPAPAADDHLAAFTAYWRDRNTVAARQELEAVIKDAGPSPVPPEYWRLKAALAAHDLAWEAAWNALRSYLQRTRPAEVLP